MYITFNIRSFKMFEPTYKVYYEITKMEQEQYQKQYKKEKEPVLCEEGNDEFQINYYKSGFKMMIVNKITCKYIMYHDAPGEHKQEEGIDYSFIEPDSGPHGIVYQYNIAGYCTLIREYENGKRCGLSYAAGKNGIWCVINYDDREPTWCPELNHKLSGELLWHYKRN